MEWKKTPVAMKTLKPGTMTPQAFLAEANIIKKLICNVLTGNSLFSLLFIMQEHGMEKHLLQSRH